MTFPDRTLLQVAALGPTVAGLLWLALLRWPWVRRAAGGGVWLAANAAAWAVFWRLYRGQSVGWGGLEPGLLQASIVPVAEIGVLLALIRAEALRERAAVGAVVALTVSMSAVVLAAYSVGLIAQALLMPIPTLAAVAASLTGSERRSFAGFGGLAAADLVGVLGLAILFRRTGSSLIAPQDGLGLGSALLLLSGAAKAGAFPGVATWRLTAGEGSAALVTAALRGQGVALTALGGPIIAGLGGSFPLAAAASGATFMAGGAALLARRLGSSLAAVCGASAAVPFMALGLGGSLGLRAFITLFPAFLLASSVALLVAWPGQEVAAAARSSRVQRWVGGAALTVAAASLAGLPPSGGFPGTWLTLDLAAARASMDPMYVVLAAGSGLGLVAAAVAAVPVLRATRPRALPAFIGAAAAGLLLYIGSFPVQVGAGWWVRVEEALDAPRLLSFVGAPNLLAIDGVLLLSAAVSVAVPIALLVLLGRGFRDVGGGFAPLIPRRGPGRWDPILRLGGELRRRGERLYVGIAVTFLIEAAAVWSIARLVIRGGDQGFL